MDGTDNEHVVQPSAAERDETQRHVRRDEKFHYYCICRRCTIVKPYQAEV